MNCHFLDGNQAPSFHSHRMVLTLLLREQVTGESPGGPATERRQDKPEKTSEPALCFFLPPLRTAAATCKGIISTGLTIYLRMNLWFITRSLKIQH